MTATAKKVPTQKKVNKKIPLKKVEEEKKVEFFMSQKDVTVLDNFFSMSLSAHSIGVLNYKEAFLKTMEMVKGSLFRKEV